MICIYYEMEYDQVPMNYNKRHGNVRLHLMFQPLIQKFDLIDFQMRKRKYSKTHIFFENN